MTDAKLSAANQKVLDLLSAAPGPLSAYDILNKLRVKGIHSPPTVYRALDKLQQMGLVHRVESLGSFVACRGACHKHKESTVAAMAICTGCGKVQEIDDPALTRAVQKWGGGFLAQVGRKVFEVSGLCRACSKGKGRACSS